MTWRTWIAVGIPPLLVVAAGCSSSADPTPHPNPKPPVVASAAACRKTIAAPSTQQPVEIVVTEKPGGVSAGERYLTKFGNLNGDCAPSGSGSSNTDSFTFTRM
jgi:hypothetical protein